MRWGIKGCISGDMVTAGEEVGAGENLSGLKEAGQVWDLELRCSGEGTAPSTTAGMKNGGGWAR